MVEFKAGDVVRIAGKFLVRSAIDQMMIDQHGPVFRLTSVVGLEYNDHYITVYRARQINNKTFINGTDASVTELYRDEIMEKLK